MIEFYSFEREDFTDLVIDTVHNSEMEKIAGAFVADKEDQQTLLAYLCDYLLDAFNDFLDENREVVFSDGGSGRRPVDTGTLIELMAGVFGQKSTTNYCRMRAFELLASRADLPVREQASKYLALASELAEMAREAGEP